MQPLSTDWTYQQFRDLILDNSNLKPGDTITVVLWACNAGEGELSSGAAILGRLFREKGINTRIVSSAAPTLRFGGQYEKDTNNDLTMRFATVNGASDIRVFDFNERETIVSKNNGPLFTTKNGISGYNLYDSKKLESVEAEPITKMLEAIFSDKHYRENIRSDQIEQELSKTKDDFILRWSSYNDTDKEYKYVFVSASIKTVLGTQNVRYGINLEGEIFSFDTTGAMEPQKINVGPKGVISAIANDVASLQEVLAIKARQQQKAQEALSPRRQHKESRHPTVTKKGDDMNMFITPKQISELMKENAPERKKVDLSKNQRMPVAKRSENPTLAGNRAPLFSSKKATDSPRAHNPRAGELKAHDSREKKTDLPKGRHVPAAGKATLKVAGNRDALFTPKKEDRAKPTGHHPTRNGPRTPGRT